MYGPMEYVVIEFKGNNFTGAIIPELEKIVENGLIHIIDLIFISKDEAGNVEAVELADLAPETGDAFEPLLSDIRGLLSLSDVERVGAMLENDTSAGLLLFEHLWAIGLQQAIRDSGGRLVAQAPVAPEDLEATLVELAEMQASPEKGE